MWPTFSSTVLLIILICIGSTFCKKHTKKKRISLHSTEIKSQPKYGLSFVNKRPFIIGIKKALGGDVEGLSKFLSDLTGTETIYKSATEHQATTGYVKNINLLHISQTEFPQIFNTERGKTSNLESENDNYIFYPFKNVYAESAPLNPDSIAIKLYDSSFNEKTDESNNNTPTSENGNQWDYINQSLYLDKYILPTKRKKIKAVLRKKNKNAMDLAGSTNNPVYSDTIILDFIRKNDLKDVGRNLLIKQFDPKIKGAIIKPISKNITEENDLKDREVNSAYYTSEDISTIPSTTSNTYSITSSNIVTYDRKTSLNYRKSISLTNETATALAYVIPTSQTNEQLLASKNKYGDNCVRSSLKPKCPLNLQIMLTLKINNDSFHLIPDLETHNY